MTRALLVVACLVALPGRAEPMLGPAFAVTPGVTQEGQSQARVVGTDTGFFVVWQAGAGRNARIRGARLEAGGQSRDASGLTLAEGPGGRFEPAVAFGHGVLFVVWSDLRDDTQTVYGARFSPDGAALDPAGLLLSTEPGARMADVAATPTGFIVAWAQAVEGGQGTEARARLLDASGMPTAAPLRLSQARRWTAGEDLAHASLSRAYAQGVRVAVLGSQAYVGWAGNSGNGQEIEVTRALVDTATGQVLAPAARAMPAPQSRVWNPTLAALPDGGVLVSWTDFRGRGVLGLAAHNGLVSAPSGLDAGVTLVSFRDDGGAREVLTPAVAPSSVVAFVAGVENPQRQRRVEWRLRVRELGPDGSSRGADVTVPEQVGWPALATGPTGITVLVTTTVNGAPGETGRLWARVVGR